MVKSGNNRISPEPVLLGYLYRASQHGYDLHKRLAKEFGSIWHASQSQTYNIIKRLEKQGFVTSTEISQEKLPAREVLQITSTGRKRFEAWLLEPTKCSVHAIRVEFVTRLYFIQQYFPEQTTEMIKLQSDVVDAGIEQLKVQLMSKSTPGSINDIALQLRIKLLYSVLEWIGELKDGTISE